MTTLFAPMQSPLGPVPTAPPSDSTFDEEDYAFRLGPHSTVVVVAPSETLLSNDATETTTTSCLSSTKEDERAEECTPGTGSTCIVSGSGDKTALLQSQQQQQQEVDGGEKSETTQQFGDRSDAMETCSFDSYVIVERLKSPEDATDDNTVDREPLSSSLLSNDDMLPLTDRLALDDEVMETPTTATADHRQVRSTPLEAPVVATETPETLTAEATAEELSTEEELAHSADDLLDFDVVNEAPVVMSPTSTTTMILEDRVSVASEMEASETISTAEAAEAGVLETNTAVSTMAATITEDATPINPLFGPIVEEEKLPYGGLNNLGNTCYLNSALQMIASLDEFATLLREHVPQMESMEDDSKKEETDGSDGTTSCSSATLREELLSVLERLAKGETFQPDSFKSKMDDRSPLFIGYRQQDSHEFLTTLLDLVDEDYKKEPKSEPEEEEKEPADDQDEMSAHDPDPMDITGATDDASSTTEAVKDQLAADLADLESLEGGEDEANGDEVDGDSDEHSHHVPMKKQRLDQESVDGKLTQEEGTEETEIAAREEANLSTSHSFKDLQFAGIQDLLHGDGTSQRSSQVSRQEDDDAMKCKLVGGRMTTAGVNLTRWDDSDNVPSTSLDTNQMAVDDDDVENRSDHILDEDEAMESKSEEKPYSPIDEYFTTEVRVCLTCNSCKYRRSHKETYLHLSLEMGSSIGSIEEGIRAFFKPEKREIKCEKCFHEYASQTTEITKLPRALLFHLKRFIVDVSPDYTSISYRKDQSSVDFGATLALNESEGALGEVIAEEVALPSNQRYGIRSIVNHIGSSASCGHYTADAHKLKPEEEDEVEDDTVRVDSEDENPRQWIRFNDSYVSKITSEDAVDNAASTAYMVLYELEKATD